MHSQAGRTRLQAGRMRLQAGRMRLRANLVGLEHVALLAQLDALVVEAALEVVGARVERHVGGTTTGLGRSLGHLVLRSLQRDEARREPLQDEVVPPPGRRIMCCKNAYITRIPCCVPPRKKKPMIYL